MMKQKPLQNRWFPIDFAFSRKYDGIFVRVSFDKKGNSSVVTRGGQVLDFPVVSYFKKIQQDTLYDGELVMKHSFISTHKDVMNGIYDGDVDQLTIMFFDKPSSLPFHQRYKELVKNVKQNNIVVQYSMENVRLQALQSLIEIFGVEGWIVRFLTEDYITDKRSERSFKLKKSS